MQAETLPARPALPKTVAVPESIARRDSTEKSTKLTAPAGPLTEADALPELSSNPALSAQQASPAITTEPVSAGAAEPPLSLAAAEQQMSKLVAEMMEGKRPDARFLQQLQEAAGGAANLLKCLRWMAHQVDDELGIRKYAFSESARHLLVATIQSLCRSPQSPF